MERPLGATERNFWLLSQITPMNVVLSARVKGQIGVARLRQALDQVQRLHPLLRVRLVGGTTPTLTARDVPQIPLRVTTDTGLAEMERELDTPFLWERGPLVRAVLREVDGEAEIMCCYSHIIGDGVSGVFLLRDVLRQLGHPEQTPEPWPERPPMDALLPAVKSEPGDTLRPDPGLLSDLVGGLMRGEAAPGQRTRLYRCNTIPAVNTRLSRRCREQKVTVHGAICAALLFAAADEAPGTAAQTLACGTAVSVRSRLTMPVRDEFGLYMSGLLNHYRIEAASTFWQVARTVAVELREDLRSNRRVFASIRDTSRLLAPVTSPRYARRLLSFANSRAPLVVSNVGRLDLPSHFGDLELLGMRGAATPQAPSQIIMVTSILHNLLTCTLMYKEPCTSPALVERLGERMIGYLAAAA